MIIHMTQFSVLTAIIILFANLGLAQIKDTKPDRMLLSAGAHTSGLKLPKGFHARIIADNLGKARHLAVSPGNEIYVKLERPVNKKGIVVLKASAPNSKYIVANGFGDYGGTGIYIKDRWLYASSNEEVFRYALNDSGQVVNPQHPEKIITGLINRRQHESKSIVLDEEGNIYVNIGAYSNACQESDRTKGSKGIRPCTILDSAGGIWQFRADRPNQTYADGVHYATGLRNVVGLDWNREKKQLLVMQHGRDQLSQLFPDLYSEEMNAELPAEAMYALTKGVDCGWPYVYYDHLQKKKMLAPEYGGNGKITAGENVLDPLMAFPGHLAPNALLFHSGKSFPEKYKNGAFIAFHGSWNRAPEEQKGYFVAFVPFINGNPSGNWEIFADNFAGKSLIHSPGEAERRPCGLAEGPDGALYVSDDVKGTIYRITYAAE
jgi:glucose/arabinose dehydrogenase